MSMPHILIVEDKAIIAKDIQATLQKVGYYVPTTVSSGEVAVEKAAELKPDLILMDIRLKGQMDGIEAAQLIRDSHDIPIIFLTAHADEETLRRAVLTEPYGYVIKPFESRELEVAIEVSRYKHRIERQLKNQKRWLSATLESIGDAVLTTDAQGKVIYLNPVAEALTGWEQKQAMGRSIDDVVELLDERSKAPVQNPLKQALQTGLATKYEGSMLLRLANGSTLLVDDIATPILDIENKIIGCVGIFRDIQLTRELEEQLRQTQKLEAIGQLTAGIAHNFNNMLTVVTLYSNMIRRTLATNDTNSSKLRVIEETAARAANMIQHLMGFARTQVMQPELLQLNDELVRVGRVLNELLPETIDLETRLQSRSDLIKIDRGQLEQIVMNLVLNARDALPGGGKITLETGVTHLEHAMVGLPSGVPAGSYAYFQVTDNGPGISRENLSRIFDPFFTTKKVGQGTGLGLSTCLGIVEQNYGRLLVESEVGEGSTFTVYLPLCKERSGRPVEPTLEEEDLEGQETILVVEDEVQIREAIALSLREYGYVVLEANNGVHALQLVEELNQPLHLLITDVVMPELGGKPLANLLKLIFDDLKVLFISGYPDGDNAPPGMQFLAKPFTPEAIALKVRELLSLEIG